MVMNYNIRYIWKAIYGPLWCLLCAVLLVSCAMEEYDTTKDHVSLQLQITTRMEGDLNTRVGEEEVGTNSEYMHNLCVLIVQNGKIIKRFLPELSDNKAAQSGNLKSWMSEAFSIEVGNYIVYAFANFNPEYSIEWNNLTKITEGENFPAVNDIVLDDPVSKINFNDSFIPMSAKEEITVTSSTKSISIGLDRLVSKIRMIIVGKDNTEVTDLAFGGYANKIPLFADGALNEVAYESSVKIAIPNEGILANGNLVIPDFYVNSSPLGHPFTVNIRTIETNGIVHDATAVTKRDELPRNSIFPLTLQLNEYGLDLQAQCWLSPIGSLPVKVAVSFLPDTYEIEVPEGCQFAFTVAGVTGGYQVTDLKGTWNIISPINGIDFDGKTAGVETVKGHVTASAGKTFDLGLLVTWKDGSASYSRKYTVILRTKDIADYPLYSKTQMLDSELDYLNQELLNIFIK